jgi:hypothetical protein
MERRIFHVISYIDDFLCVEDSFERCLECMEVLSVLLVSLGFVINDQKREGPAETLTFLGVSIDCVTGVKITGYEDFVGVMVRKGEVYEA